jgi:phosphate-selective porin OprO/OprP
MKQVASIIVLFAFADIVHGQVFDPENVLIENVYLASETAGESTVNLLIRKNELVIVSEDRIPLPEGFTALDADKGFLVGNLVVGEPPDFIILATDPREDMAALMDTRANATYMVYQGELRKNTLEASEGATEVASGHPVWHAYLPPPVALPTSHDPGAYWNHWSTENTKNVLFGVLALDRQGWPSQDSASEEQVGDLEVFEGGEIRDIRVGMFGTLDFFGRPWGYTLSLATNAFDKEFEEGVLDNFRAIDYRLDIPVWDSMTLTVGKQKEPISMERMMTLINLPMQERSAPYDAFLRSRNFGAQLSGTARDRRISWAGGIFSDFIDEDLSVGDATTSVTGRVTWLPYLSEDESNLLHLAIGARLSNGEQPVRYRVKPEFNKSPMFVDTGLFDADRIDQLSLEASWRRGPFWLAAEHLSTSADSPTEGRLDFSGYFVTASWILTGEMRTYKRGNGTFGPVPVARPARGNGFGAWEIATRWSSIDLDDGPIQGGNMDILSLSLSWWLSSTANMNLNYRYIVNDRFGLSGETGGVNLRLLLKLN